MMKKLVLGGVISLLCTGVAFAERLEIAAGSTATDMVVAPTKAAFEKATGIGLESYKLPSKAGIAKLGTGEVQAVLTDASLDGVLADIKKGSIAFSDPGRLKMVVLLKTNTVVVVHKDNPVSALNKEQLKAIFTGKAKGWKEFGGPDAPIVVPVSGSNKGTQEEFSKKILDKEPLLKDAAVLGTDEEVKDFIASTPEAIGLLASKAMVDANMKCVTTPEIAKTVNYFTVGEPAGGAKKLLDFLNGAGKKLYAKQ